jgi:hypothetical protein
VPAQCQRFKRSVWHGWSSSLRLVQTVSPQLPCAFHADAGVPCPFLSTRFAPRWFARGLQTHRTGAHAAQAAFTREYP